MNTKNTAALTALVASALLMSACDVGTPELDGVQETRAYEVTDFTQIEISGSGDVTIEVGPEPSVTATADTAVLPDVEVRVTGERLVLGERRSVLSWGDVHVEYVVTVPALEAVELSGASDVTITGLAGDQFGLELTGAGDVTATGAVNGVRVQLDGSGNVDFAGLAAATATLDLSGSGDVRIHATDLLSVDLSGSGDVWFSGGGRLDQDVSGAGEVTRANP